MRPLNLVLDNPLIIRHMRSRLRLGPTLSQAIAVATVCIFFAWLTHYIHGIDGASSVLIMIGIQVLLLTIGGAVGINTSLGGARATGILDFHRVAPFPPAGIALGFFLGAPIREYAVALITVPFACWSAYSIDAFDGWRGMRWLAQIETAVLVSTWVLHGVVVLSCLTRKKPQGAKAGGIAMLFILLVFGGNGVYVFYFGSLWVLNQEQRLNFFGMMIPWLLWVLLYEVPALGFVALAATRKMRAERAHALSKPQALSAMAALTVLAGGGVWNVARLIGPGAWGDPTQSDTIMLISVYALMIAAMVLTVPITPDANGYLKGLRRARREGRRRARPWADAASNRMALAGLCVLVLVGTTTIVNVVGRSPGNSTLTDAAWLASRRDLLSRPIAIAVLTAAYFGLALQYFSVRTRSSGGALLATMLGLVWLAPPLAAFAIAVLSRGSANRESLAVAVAALSPLPGIVLASGLGLPAVTEMVRLAALAPPIALVFLFNYLLVVTQRKIDRLLLAQEKAYTANPGPDTDDVAMNGPQLNVDELQSIPENGKSDP